MPETFKQIKGTTVAFGDVVQLSKERSNDPERDGFERYFGLEHLKPSDLKVCSWGDIVDGTTFTSVFKPGQVLFGKRRAYQRKVAVADFSGVCSGDIYVLEPKGDELLPELLPFICQSESFYDYVISMSQGGLSPRVNWKSLAKYEFLLPPLDEQRRIAEVLQAAERMINALRMLGTEMESLRRSSIDELTFGLAAKISKVGEHCEMQNGRPFPGNEYCDDGQRLLRPGNLAPSGYLTWDEDKTKRVPHHYRDEASDFVVEPGNVLINLTAQSLEDGFMGRVCLVRDGDQSLLNQRIGRFRRFSGQLEPEFLFRILQSSDFQRHAISMCEGSKIKHLFWEHISRFEFPLLDTVEQSRRVEELGSLDTAVRDAERRLEVACKLKDQLLWSALPSHADASV